MHTKKQLMVKKYELYFLHAHVYLYASYNIYYTQSYYSYHTLYHTKVQLRFRLS